MDSFGKSASSSFLQVEIFCHVLLRVWADGNIFGAGSVNNIDASCFVIGGVAFPPVGGRCCYYFSVYVSTSHSA